MAVEIADLFAAPVLNVTHRFGPDSGGAAAFVHGMELTTTAAVDLSTPLPGFLTFRRTGDDGGHDIGVLTLRMAPQAHTALRDQNFRDRLLATEIILEGVRRDWITTDLTGYVVGTDEVAGDAELAAAGIGTPAANVTQFWENERYLYLPTHAVLGQVPDARDLTLRCRAGGDTPWFQDPVVLFGGQPWLNLNDPDLFLFPDATVHVTLFDPAGTDDLVTVIAATAPAADAFDLIIVPGGNHAIDTLATPAARVLLYGAPRAAAPPTLTATVHVQLGDPQELAFAGFRFDLQDGRVSIEGFGTAPPVPWSVRFTQCTFIRPAPNPALDTPLHAAVDRLLLLGCEFRNGNGLASGGAFRLHNSFGSVVVGNEFRDNTAVQGGAFHVQDCSQLAFTGNRFQGNTINPAGASTDGYVDNRFNSPPEHALDMFEAQVVTRAEPPVHARFLYNETDAIEVVDGSIGVQVVSGRQVTAYLRFVLERTSNLNPGGVEQVPYTPSRVLLYYRERAYSEALEVTTANLNLRTTPDSTVGDDNLIGSVPEGTLMVLDPGRTAQNDGAWQFQPVLLDPRWLPDFAPDLYRWDEVPRELWAADQPVGGGAALAQKIENEYTSLPTFIRELPVEGGRPVLAVEPGSYLVAVPEIARCQEIALEPGDAGTELTLHFEYGLTSDLAGFNTLPQAKRQLVDTGLALPATDRLVAEVLAEAAGINVLQGRTVPGTAPPRLDLTLAHLVTGVLQGAGLAPTWAARVPSNQLDYYLPVPTGDIAGHITTVNDLTQLQPGDVVLTGEYHAVPTPGPAPASGPTHDVTMGRVTGGWLFVGAFHGTDVVGRTFPEDAADPYVLLAARAYDAADRSTVMVEGLRRSDVAALAAPVWDTSAMGAVADADIHTLPTGVDVSGDGLAPDPVSGELVAGAWMRHLRFNAVAGLTTAGLPTALTLAVDAAHPPRMNLAAQGAAADAAVTVRIETNPGTSAADPQGDYDLYGDAISVHPTADLTVEVAATPEFDTVFDHTGELRLSFDVTVQTPVRVRLTVAGQRLYSGEARLESDLHAMLDDPQFFDTTLGRADPAWNGLRLALAPAPAGLHALGRMSDAPDAHTNFQALAAAHNIIVPAGGSYRRIGAGPQGTHNGLMEPGVTSLDDFLSDYDFQTGPGLSPDVTSIITVATAPEGKIEANNTWDDSFMSIGPGQWTMGSTADNASRGELAGLLELFDDLAPDAFREHFYALDIGYANVRTETLVRKGYLSVSGTALNTRNLKDQHIRHNLRNINAIHYATDDPRFRLTMVYFLIKRVYSIFELIVTPLADYTAFPSYSDVPDGYKSPRLLAYLLSFHIKRPTWVQETLWYRHDEVQNDDGVPEIHARLRRLVRPGDPRDRRVEDFPALPPADRHIRTDALNAGQRADMDDRLNHHLVPAGLDTLPVAPFEDNVLTLLAEELEKIRVELGGAGAVLEPAGVAFSTVSPPANANRYGGFTLRNGDNDAAQRYDGAVQPGGPFTYVQTLQEDLLRLGYWVSDPTNDPAADGDFGARTETGLKTFQREAGVGTPTTTTGRVDDDTLAALVAALNDADWHRPGVPTEDARCFQLQPSWDPEDASTPYYLRYPALQEAGPTVPAEDTFENNDCWAKLDTLLRLEGIANEWDTRGHNVAGDRLTVGDMSMIAFHQMPGRGPTSHRSGAQIDIRSEHSMGNLLVANDPADPAHNGHNWNRTAEFVLLAMAKGFNRIFTNCIHAYREAVRVSPGQRQCAPEPNHHHHVHIERGANLNPYPRDAHHAIDESAEAHANQFCRAPGTVDGFCAVHGACPHFTTYP